MGWNRTTKVLGSLGRASHQPRGGAGTWLGEGTDHPDGLHVPVDEGEETLSAKGHVLLLLAQLGFLHVLSASSRLQL
jgi:hypothetical protein